MKSVLIREAEIKLISSSKCNTRFPIVFIHGAGFRDNKYLNYWGRIPRAIEEQGGKVFYGRQDALGTIEYNAEIIKKNIIHVLKETGTEKVNLIAHSKGGLEARYLIYKLNMGEHIASLTTLSTPHYGSKLADKIYYCPDIIYKFLSIFMNCLYKLLGDKKPDFYNVSRELTTKFCEEFNKKIINVENVYYQSYTSIMKSSLSDILLCIPHFIMNRIDGENDGLVTIDSAKWGVFQGVIRNKSLRGISHADIVDLRRTNYCEIDIREIYIGIVEDLKDMGF